MVVVQCQRLHGEPDLREGRSALLRSAQVDLPTSGHDVRHTSCCVPQQAGQHTGAPCACTGEHMMVARFRDRHDAGQRLAERLSAYAGGDDVVVLALPRGGVPVAVEVARRLSVRLDVFLVRKLGVPGHEELAFGAMAGGGVRVLNEDVVRQLGVSDEVIEAVSTREGLELARRERLYREGRPPLDLRSCIALLVDDGLATGATMRAAATALRRLGPRRIVVAVPVAAPSTAREMGAVADDVVALITPEPFGAVGLWYEDFAPTLDDEVHYLLAQAYSGAAPGAGDRVTPREPRET